MHLGQEDMDTADLAAIAAAGLRLGLSTHSVAELDRALSVHPSYVASGAIFPTTTKQMPTAPQGLDKLREYVKQAVGTPVVVAIGGIDLNNAEDVLATGVSSLAVVRAVTEAENPEAVVKAFRLCGMNKVLLQTNFTLKNKEDDHEKIAQRIIDRRFIFQFHIDNFSRK